MYLIFYFPIKGFLSSDLLNGSLFMDFYSEIIELILSKKIQGKEELHKAKIRLCKKYSISVIPPDSKILARLPDDFSDEQKEYATSLLRKKATRSISGVAVVAVMTSPAECPHGLCIPCPGGPSAGTPQSYTGHEPAALRASLNDFDPFLQTRNRIEQLKAIGHPVDKIDFIIMGGTFTARDPFYQDWFVKRCFDGLNNKNSKNLSEAQKINETAKTRCIGLTVETRPDWFRLRHCDLSLSWGATRVELGVQTVYDDILSKINRGHTVTDSILATRIAKDAGLKVTYHMMPNLLDSSIERDKKAFKMLFKNDCFKPDGLKIYPTLVTKGTRLYEMLEKNEYRPYSQENVIELISGVKKIIPKWVRIQRVQRDIPSNLIISGVKNSNLRQIIHKNLQNKSFKCRCIRCREVGHVKLKRNIEPNIDNIKLLTEKYFASDGEEIFFSYEDTKQDILIAFLRLRYPSEKAYRSEITEKNAMIVRELHVYGPMNPLNKKIKNGWQHKGYGKQLLKIAEKTAGERYDAKKIVIISGVGVKNYYYKNGYKRDGPYVSKILN